MTTRIQSLFLAIAVSSFLVFSGCAKKTEEKIAPMPQKDQGSQTVGQPESLDTPTQPSISEGRTSAPMLPVYFDFDDSNIREDQVSRAIVNADFLKENPDVKVRIEGNCDPRGTNEYNMALGERRALSAKKYLQNLGVEAARMTTISFGEERILLHGHDELSWAQNRRDDFVIQ
jgi:peptidoglycan-associated lipoprotein